MKSSIEFRDFSWRGDKLIRLDHVVARIEPDAEWPGMWRIRWPDGSLSDMYNRTRAKNNAIALLVAKWNASHPWRH